MRVVSDLDLVRAEGKTKMREERFELISVKKLLWLAKVLQCAL